MNANDLQTRIEVWKYDYSDNAGGTPIETFKFYRYKYAKIEKRGGSTQEGELGKLPYTTVTFTIRYDKTIDYRCQIKWLGVFYEITHIEIKERLGWMVIQTNVYNERLGDH